MYNEYKISYTAQNTYENWVDKAYWQFMIVPVENASQKNVQVDFENTMGFPMEFSHSGHGFRTLRVHSTAPFKEIAFKAKFSFVKTEDNPFDFVPSASLQWEYDQLAQLSYQVDFDQFLKRTILTQLPVPGASLFAFDKERSIFENLMALNTWIYEQIHYTPGVTDVDTTLDQMLEIKKGVCQDFTHLFCAIAKDHGVPARYVSGYLNQDGGFFGDTQMHAWAEAHIPGVGWKGFDATNNILANTNHVKVCHGKDYSDCAPLKGVIFAQGENTTTHSVSVHSQQ
jgi:transglutaminase-like putative cysteine protease